MAFTLRHSASFHLGLLNRTSFCTIANLLPNNEHVILRTLYSRKWCIKLTSDNQSTSRSGHQNDVDDTHWKCLPRSCQRQVSTENCSWLLINQIFKKKSYRKVIMKKLLWERGNGTTIKGRKKFRLYNYYFQILLASKD